MHLAKPERIEAALAPWIAPYSPTEQDVSKLLLEPSWVNWLGTDDLGRDVLSRTLYGARLSLIIGFGATLISLVIGVPLGLIAGFKRGRIDERHRQAIGDIGALGLRPAPETTRKAARAGPGAAAEQSLEQVAEIARLFTAEIGTEAAWPLPVKLSVALLLALGAM